MPVERNQPHEAATHAIEPITPDEPLFQDWLTARREYMERLGWHYGDDRDEYDNNPRTLHVIKRKGKEIMMGMRFTPISDIKESLSWSMLSEELKQQVDRKLPEVHENTWDVTRLVPGNAQGEEAAKAVLETYGAGLELTSLHSPDIPPRWFFVTTPKIVSFFKSRGADFQEIARGKNHPGDTEAVAVCYVDPVVPELAGPSDRRRVLGREALLWGMRQVQG